MSVFYLSLSRSVGLMHKELFHQAVEETRQKITRRRRKAEEQRRDLRKLLEVDSTRGLINPERKSIIEKPIDVLLEALKEGRLAPIKVLEAFQVCTSETYSANMNALAFTYG